MAEFKIGRLRYTWKGYWVTGTFYNRDAIVSYNGKTYVCLVPHTSGIFYDDIVHYDPELGSTPYWEIMLEGTSWKGNWEPLTVYVPGNIVLYSGTLYKCKTNHTSGSTTIDLSKWDIYITVNSTWTGNYTANVLYRFGDVAKYNGIVYRCTEEHTSATLINYSKWEILNVGIEYQGEWNSSSYAYRKNDIVKLNADLWIATTDHTSSLPFDEANWDLWIPGLEYGNTWTSLTTYQIGDVVKYGGYSYVNRLTNNIGIVPSTNPEQWEVLTTGYDVKDEWIAGAYKIGSVVRRGGNVFVAVKDNINQDPTDINLSKIYTATGSSGLTVKLNNTTGVAPGMIVSGDGVVNGQFVTKVIDEFTILISQSPYSTITDGAVLSFTGVNSDNWELIAAGPRWTNRWINSASYITGDVAVWKNATYICIRTHVSDNTSRPDLDNLHSKWVRYLNHDQYNVLNLPGDIVVNSSGTNQSLPIGPEGFLLKSVYGVPTWKNVFQTPSVYYVAPTGTDSPASGDTWDNPFKSIKFACERIAQGSSNLNVKQILTTNRDFIIAEIDSWVKYQVQYSNVPFLSSNIIDSSKTKRDTSFLLDAIVYDITRGGNSQTIAFLYSYFDKEYSNQYATPEIAALISQFIATINRVFTVVNSVLSGITISPLYQILNNNPVTISQSMFPPVDSQVIVDISGLQEIIIAALSQGNTNSIPPENQGLTATLMVKTGTYEETLPILVPANTALVGDELRGAVVRPKVIINTMATRTQAGINLITVKTTEGLENNTPVQFASINPYSEINTVFGGLESGKTYYVIGASITNTTFSVSDTLGGPVVPLVNYVSQMHVYGGDAISDMFRVQNGTGIRNMTLAGLLGTLSDANEFSTRRPTGGAYVSLDPGTGPDDTSAWIYRKSPYIQNVTTFGVGAVGLKIDGNLHNGGNKSAVANDFTQIISDGIGVWVTGPESLCEAVSVFTYYGYAGYFAEDGGRIRATNGNSSYGTYGVVAEGFNNLEIPITGQVFNRYYEATATPLSSLGAEADILKLQYSHAGENYFQATTNILTHSNLFTNWTTDGNVTLIQSVESPTGRSDGWIAAGNTSGTDSSYFYQNVSIAPSGATYSNLSADSQTGLGLGATFDVIVTSTEYLVSINAPGSGYVTTNELVINGSKLGGLDGVNDLTITVTGLTGTSISLISISGVVQIGSIQPYTFSIYCKKGTAPLMDVVATFSGYSSVSSGITYNFLTNAITPFNANNGLSPTVTNSTPIYGREGWHRVDFQFYDTTALNDTLQIRIYPRSRFGNAGYSLFYGAQLEVGNTLGFYLKTDTEKFTSHANFEVIGAGSSTSLIGNELRSKSVFQTRILESSGVVGGDGYIVSTNNAQLGDDTTITIAQSDVAGEKDYLGMRVFINSGAGAGQYGNISSFDTTSKIARVLKDSFSPIEILVTEAGANTLTMSGSDDVNTLYSNQPIEFVPTNYQTVVTKISQKTLSVTETIGGTTNTMNVGSTARLAVDMPITFSGTTFGGVTSNFTYYVLSIVDNSYIQVSLTVGGAAVLLNSVSTQVMTLNYPASTGHLYGDTTNMEINLPIYFTGNVFSDVTPGQTYYINEIYSDTEFTISSSLATINATASTAVSNIITVSETTALRSLNPIIFTGTGFGGISSNVKYYINHIVDLTHITASAIVIDTIATSSAGSSDLITVDSTAGFVIGNPITITGTTFGNIVNDKVYYIHYVNDLNTFTISNTSTELTITATQTFVSTDYITVNTTTNLMPLNPIKFSGTVFGNIVAGTEYYISRIVNTSTIQVSPSIISVIATGTEETSNLITVSSTLGFVSNNPIIFGGNTIGGITSGTVYYISAVNDETTFTVSAAQGGSAVSLSTASGTMTARTTAASVILQNGSGTMTGTTRYTGTPVNLATGVGECSVRTTGPTLTLTTGTGTLTGNSTVIKESLSSSSGSMTGTFTVPLIGGISTGVTYYVKTITVGPPNKFSISTIPGGSPVALTSDTGSMRLGEPGWDHVNPGTPLASNFDSTTVYSIEPLISYSKPNFSYETNTNVITQPPGTSYISTKYGNRKFVAIPSTGLTFSSSSDGYNWTQGQLPTSATWADLAYGNKYWVLISSGGTGIPGSKVLFSNSNLVTWKTSYLPSISNWSKVVYGNGKFVAISETATAVSTNYGTSWTAGSISADVWVSVTYGNGKFVAVSPTNSKAAYSTDGINWTVVSLPRIATWSDISFGNGRFVAVASGSGKAAFSFDGATWYESKYPAPATNIEYGNGVFLASSSNSASAYTSEDGINWTVRTIPLNTSGVAFGFTSSDEALFINTYGQNSANIVRAGCQTKARAEVYQNKIVKIYEWEPGSNYSAAPTVTITDTNATKPASVTPQIGNGVLANPTFFNRGVGYNTTSTTIVINGGGYAENYQVGLQLIFNNLTRLPSAGDNLTFEADATVYKVTSAEVLDGTSEPNITAMVSVSPSISVANSPAHEKNVTIRTKYSQVRLTNHDFLNIGYGNIEESNFPGLPASTLLSPENEAVESNYGRVFYSSTDQDGNFKVGKLFAVEQATGIVTLSASQFGLQGLSQLKLGGIAIGGNSVIITQFSTDSTFVANANNIIPTQKAIKGYLTARLSQGGANTFTGQLIAGTVLIGGPDKIASTLPEGNEGSHVNIPVKANITAGNSGAWDGDGMALSYFIQSFVN